MTRFEIPELSKTRVFRIFETTYIILSQENLLTQHNRTQELNPWIEFDWVRLSSISEGSIDYAGHSVDDFIKDYASDKRVILIMYSVISGYSLVYSCQFFIVCFLKLTNWFTFFFFFFSPCATRLD